jgi:hypothetical protein
MTVRIQVTGDPSQLDKTLRYLETFDDTVREIYYKTALEAWDEIKAQFLTALQFYPPVPAGSRYQRTFRLRRGWQVDLELANDTVTVVVFNPTTYTSKVMGALTTVDSVARQAQQAFHARNGWPIALDTTRTWFNIFKDAFLESFTEALIKDAKSQ